MPRRTKVFKKDVVGDPIYQNLLVNALIKKVMEKGKKSVAEKIVYSTFDELSSKAKKEPLEVFETAMKNVAPIMEVKSRRVGGSTYQVPVEVRRNRSISLALRWIVGNARDRKGRSMIEKLTAELMDAYNNTGSSIKKREDTHKMADANKAFAHFKW